ncbi:uncharacterized protein LOC116417028 [Nasonia vitripennis]|uniref:CCHC-type domain-containing protein n=1 Tax=Nasonia vitripennis TaxID=7425 RepID=A0A7M7R3X5_NASVI|nr:uncharacterized protein LOC116417028 [Nasonia vitripennis]
MDNLENALERHSDILDNHAEIIRDQTVAILDMKENIDNLNTVIQKLTEQIGKLTSELESDRRKSDGQPSDDRQKIAVKQAIITDKCYRCNKVGHRAAFCPLKEYNLWYCFYCQAVAPHKGDDCPNKDNPKDGYVKSYTYNNTNTQHKHNSNNFRGRGNRGRGGYNNVRGRGNNVRRGSFKRKVDIQTPGRNQKKGYKVKAMLTGNNTHIINKTPTKLVLIADSGATEHIVNKSIILNNLISLRRFADVGLSIYLDNKILKIYDKNSDEEYLAGTYEKPNWIISLNVAKHEQSDEQQEVYDKYSCTANIVSVDEFLQQSQSDIKDLED